MESGRQLWYNRLMNMIGNDWDEILAEEFKKEYFADLTEFVASQRAEHQVYPPKGCTFKALECSSYADAKVVILGQDPYHQPGQAMGLCFSVAPGVQLPPSLVNIYKELEADLGIPRTQNGDLTSWAEQGVLLLNAVLTVRDSEPNSHKGKGWETFTDAVIKKLNARPEPMVFILWGNNAKEKLSLITNPDHLILTGAHPSPLSASRGFFGGKYFSRANRFLELEGKKPIDWASVSRI